MYDEIEQLSIIFKKASEEALKKWKSDPGIIANERHRNILDEFNIIPIPTGSDSLGRGAYGTVYNGIYKGKPIAAKITSPEDSLTYEKVMNLRDSVPENIRKHLPVVYLVSESESKDKWGDNSGVVLMEFLRPLDNTLKAALFGQGLYGKAHAEAYVEVAIANIDDIYNQLKSLYLKEQEKYKDFMGDDKFIDLDSTNIKSKLMESLKHVLQASRDRTFLSAISLPMQLKDYINSNVVSDIAKMDNGSMSSNFSVQSIVSAIYSLSEVLKPQMVPTGYTEDSEFSSQDPRIDSFNSAMQQLGKIGVEYFDAHSENLMVRPSTGDIVFADVGMFYLPEEE